MCRRQGNGGCHPQCRIERAWLSASQHRELIQQHGNFGPGFRKISFAGKGLRFGRVERLCRRGARAQAFTGKVHLRAVDFHLSLLQGQHRLPCPQAYIGAGNLCRKRYAGIGRTCLGCLCTGGRGLDLAARAAE